MKNLLENLYKYLFQVDIIQKIEVPIILPPIIPPKTNREKLLDLAYSFLGTDPTPKDEVPDEISCVFSLTTILKKLYPDFTVLSYTPVLVTQLQNDKRFKVSNELKAGNVIVYPTLSGNGKIMGHTFICGKEGKMLSNNSDTGLWQDKYDINKMIDRYSREGQLKMYIFELV